MQQESLYIKRTADRKSKTIFKSYTGTYFFNVRSLEFSLFSQINMHTNKQTNSNNIYLWARYEPPGRRKQFYLKSNWTDFSSFFARGEAFQPASVNKYSFLVLSCLFLYWTGAGGTNRREQPSGTEVDSLIQKLFNSLSSHFFKNRENNTWAEHFGASSLCEKLLHSNTHVTLYSFQFKTMGERDI